tara:strand:+ start:65 stop:514 length:450 start_codon:yes stop_codon:yes gene_type:complete
MNKKRECGECTLCCLILPIIDTQSPPNTLCKHCTLSKGCGIYDTRPNNCRNYNCEWILSDDIPMDLKPNKSHMIFEKITHTIQLANLEHTHLDAWKEQNVLDYIQELNDKGISVIISSFTNTEKVIFPSTGRSQSSVVSEAISELNNKQ